MSFFDSKQETINIELTSYGKMLLSKGKFKPVYYAFFDDDIVYDSRFIDISESQNSIQQRIMNETPVNKPQYKFVGADKSVKKNNELYNQYTKIFNNTLEESEILKLIELQNNSEKNYALSLPIGKSSYNSEYYPAWSIKCIEGTISSSNPYVDNTGSNNGYVQPYLKIPQINMQDSIQELLLLEDGFLTAELEDYENIGFSVDADGNTTTINIKLEKYLLEIMEKNVDDVKDNFDIEVFVEEPASYNNSSTSWKQLGFVKKRVEVKNNILLDKPEEPENAQDLVYNPNFVEHYLNILVDDEIILPDKQKIEVDAYISNIKPTVTGDDC